jgi:hypothetical protein
MSQKYEILHSGEYWQTLRRHKAARAAHIARQPEEFHNSGQWDGAAVVTFVPGNPIPYTSVLYANGALVPVGPSSSNPPAAARPRKRVARPVLAPHGSNIIRRCQEREDAELLARLTAPRTALKRRGEALEGEEGRKKK